MRGGVGDGCGGVFDRGGGGGVHICSCDSNVDDGVRRWLGCGNGEDYSNVGVVVMSI